MAEKHFLKIYFFWMNFSLSFVFVFICLIFLFLVGFFRERERGRTQSWMGREVGRIWEEMGEGKLGSKYIGMKKIYFQ